MITATILTLIVLCGVYRIARKRAEDKATKEIAVRIDAAGAVEQWDIEEVFLDYVAEVGTEKQLRRAMEDVHFMRQMRGEVK